MSRPMYVKPPALPAFAGVATPLSGGRQTRPGSGTKRVNGAGGAGFASRSRLVALIALRAAFHVPDVALARVLRRHGDPGRVALREGVLRDRAQVVLGDELFQR